MIETIPVEALAVHTLSAISSREGWIYGLTDPSRGALVAYIGQTVNLLRRYFEHCDPDHPKGDARRDWLLRLAEQGLVPGCLVLERVPTVSLLAAESWWIMKASTLGLAWLNRNAAEPDRPLAPTAMDEMRSILPTPPELRPQETARMQVLEARKREELRRSEASRIEVLTDQARIEAVRREVEKDAKMRRKLEQKEREAAIAQSQAEFERRVMVKANELISGIERRLRNVTLIGRNGISVPARTRTGA